VDLNNPYSFSEFLKWREEVDYYGDDQLVQAVVKKLAGDSFAAVHQRLQSFSNLASHRWQKLAEAAARPQRHPSIRHFDGHGNRIDRLVRPQQMLDLEREVFGEGLFSAKTSALERVAMLFVLNQNGEGGIVCPLACTEGLIAMLRLCGGGAELQRIHTHLTEGIDGDYAIGAQYLSEIQGGSDVRANVVEAVPDGPHWRLFGQKFFCSATHADYCVVTAKPRGSDRVGTFVVESWLPGDKAKQRRNGYTIDRVKWKMGTSELPTSELTFAGALAYQLGPLESGLANVVGIVLTLSRLGVGIGSAGFMTRAAREARAYTRFRRAFGQVLGDFPMVQGQLEAIEETARRTTAGAFSLYLEYARQKPPRTSEERLRAFCLRELVMLQKIVAASEATDVIRTAMSLFGGHGVMEDFSVLPRFYRDAAVNELWEGPRNVLLLQVHRDMKRAVGEIRPTKFVRAVLAGADESCVAPLASEFEELVAFPSLSSGGTNTVAACRSWDNVCTRLVQAWQETILDRQFS
jgi:alkylation response protein AidB-like acyl-CoA dehydrogenase